MKIHYTLPGYQAETEMAKDVLESFGSPFQNRLRAFQRRQPVAWRDILGLNRNSPELSQLSPPPHTADQNEPAALRQQWRDLLSRHSGFEESVSSGPSVRRMMVLLESMQKDSDMMFAKSLSSGEPG